MALSRVLAVDTGAGHVASGAFAVAKGGRLALEHFALNSFNSDAAAEGQWNRAVAQALKGEKQSSKLKGAAVAVMPGHLTLTKFVKTPSVEKSKRAKMIQFEAQQSIPYALEEVVCGCDMVADDGLDIDLFLAATKINVAEGLCSSLVGAGLRPQAVVPSVYALYRAFKYNHPGADDCDLLISIGARSTHLIFSDKGRFFSRTVPLAGNNLTQAISDEIKQDFSHAETLKLQVLGGRSELAESSPARKAVMTAVQNFIGQLHIEITRSILSFRRMSGVDQPARVHITGGGSLIPSFTQTLAAKLNLTVDRFDPLKNVDVASGAAEARERAAILADLVGAAIIRAEQKKGAMNLLPPSLVAVEAFRRQQPFYVLAAAVLVIALAVPAVSFYKTAATAREKTATIIDDVKRMDKIQSSIESNAQRLKLATDQIAGIKDLAASMANWINFLESLQTLLTKAEDVWLDSLKVVRTDPVASGAGSVTADKDGAPAEAIPTLRLDITGRLLDRNHPLETISVESSTRVRELLNSFATSQFVVSREKERFDSSDPGILKFQFTLVVNPKKPL
jgi:type IV pilus assembly protein PilM